jgi:spermidine synthase
LNIGLGCGFTAAAVAKNPNIFRLDVAEINPVVVKMARRHFADVTDDVLRNPKVHLVVRDGAEVLRHAKHRYDAIVIDIEEPAVIHSSPLFTQDYFEIARARLEPSGMFALWLFRTGADYGKVIANTLRAVFAHVEIRVAGLNLHYFASDAPLRIPPPRLEERRTLELIEASGIDDINTIDNRSIERYFDLSKAFGLPDDYSERRTR